VLAALLLAVVGCSGHNGVYPVTGKIFYRGTPATGAIVVFHPVGDDSPMALRPSGVVDAQGEFHLTTHRPKDGAPEGVYSVAIYWPEVAVIEERGMRGAGESRGAADRFRGVYRPGQSQLTATVQPKVNVIESFQLQ
jgi:hypothetical protein